MNGTVLVLDAIATSRIMLKVQLSAAYYHVIQSEDMAGLVPLVRRSQPDLILCAMTLPDGGALAARAVLGNAPDTARIPIIALAPQNDRAARLMALRAGLDDVLNHPVDDALLQARIRSLIRSRAPTDDRRDGPDAMGLSEPAAAFDGPARVTLVTRSAATGAAWQAELAALLPHRLRCCDRGDLAGLMRAPPADAFVLDIAGAEDHTGLNLLSELRARAAPRGAAVIAVMASKAGGPAADALDRGAHDVVTGGLDGAELALRLDAQLRRKARSDRLRASVRKGLKAALRDPMTGLYNRRHALPHLAQLLRRAGDTGRPLAVMMADLDHFKSVNDRYGHLAGDAVLVDTAARLQRLLRPVDMIARLGGEEFLIAMPEAGTAAASAAARRLCRQINRNPVWLPGFGEPIRITVSIGVAVTPPAPAEVTAGDLIGQADQALYRAKHAGRNQVRLIRSAA
ncbi:diguanylate cyclase [Pseudooceanicola sp.]|uniref:diguanylate cyclase n=1 Tax=Pseudooceanicola sp. TaxID=1914328 RepID=UPI0035183DCE